MEITKQTFLFMVDELANKNSKVKQLINDCKGYDNLPKNIKVLIDKELNITRSEKIELNL